jgi:hypothetical protein
LADRGVRFVLGTAVDFSGVTRAKGVPVERFKTFVETGVGASPSWLVFCVDFGIAFIPGLGTCGCGSTRRPPSWLIMEWRGPPLSSSCRAVSGLPAAPVGDCDRSPVD